MNPEQLLLHFDRISEAPDAIPKLRRFILNLAVRGKLVEQDPNDEPATELLKRVQAEKKLLMVQRRIRPNKDVEYSESNDEAYSPKGWCWVHIDDIAIIQGGKRLPAGAGFTKEKTPHIYIRVTDMKDGTIRTDNPQYITSDIQKVISQYTIGKEDLYITIAGTIGQIGRVPPTLDGQNLTENAAKIVFREIDPDFLYLVLSADAVQEQFRDKTKQMAQPKLALKRIAGARFPLPPLAEQHRIVAKVDELMALCDQLQAAQSEREQGRDRLVAASLQSLNPPADDEAANAPEAQREHARFISNHLPRLTTRPAHIKQLRQTILNLAVRGKLVPQDPNDEPVTELLKRIDAEKVRLGQEGKFKKDKSLKPILLNDEPFKIPNHWIWVRLGELTELITKGSSPKWQGVTYSSKENGILFITSENVGNYSIRKLEDLKYVDKRFNEIEPRSILSFGDILMNLVGASIGRTAVYDLQETANINQAVALIRLIKVTENQCTPFFLHYFNSPDAIKIMLASQVVAAQPNLSLTNAREFPVPLPPLAEQHRIVAKVDELMALCDQLETQLTSTAADSRRLLEAMLHEALLPAAEQAA